MFVEIVKNGVYKVVHKNKFASIFKERGYKALRENADPMELMKPAAATKAPEKEPKKPKTTEDKKLEVSKVKATVVEDDSLSPKQKLQNSAKELGIKFNDRTTAKQLEALIAEKEGE